MTTLSAITWSPRRSGAGRAGWKRAIIGTLCALVALALGGCTALRVAYNTGPQLAWWWLDGYVDFSSEQTPQVKASIDRWFEWHKQTQLPGYITLLASAQAQAEQPLTPAAACQWNTRITDALMPAVNRAVDHAADIVPGLGDAQLRHLEQRYAKNIEEMKSDYLQPDLAERRAAAMKRALTRAEQIYGRLDEPQRKVIAEGLASSPFDPQALMEERKRRQRDTLQTLRRLIADRADREQRVVALRGLVERSQHSPDASYRAYQQRVVEHNCAAVARLHNAATPAQRQRARATLKGYEGDVRAVLQGPAGDSGVPGTN